jgi:mono/diheme cytochrome c family protein
MAISSWRSIAPQVLEVAGKGDAAAPSKPFRLRKGTNALTATFRSPAQGDAFVRLFWFNKETVRQPIPLAALTCSAANAALEQASRFGWDASYSSNSVARNVTPDHRAIPECLSWRWTRRRSKDRFAAQLRLAGALDYRSESIASNGAYAKALARSESAGRCGRRSLAFLVSLRSDAAGSVASKDPSDEDKEFGRKLFETLHCVACHNAPEAREVDEMKISLKQVREKFSDDMLAVFLANPEAHYAWIRMPRFKLTADEIRQLTGYLNANADKPKETPALTDSSVIESGRKLVQTSGCLNCHGLKLENQFSAKPLADWRSTNGNRLPSRGRWMTLPRRRNFR